MSSTQSGVSITYGTEANSCTLSQSPTFTEAGNHTVYFQVACAGYNTIQSSTKVCIWPEGTALSETFDLNGLNLPDGWTSETTENGQWVVEEGYNDGFTAAHSGTYNAVSPELYSNNVCKLTSPIFAVDGSYNAARLNFWYANRGYSTYFDELIVYYRTEADGALTRVANITSKHDNWAYASYLLPATACQVVFEYKSHNGYTIGLDDVEVVGVHAYAIDYTLNGGTVATANPTIYDDLAEITLTNPTRDYHDFTGWTGSNGSTPQTTVTISKDSTGDRSYEANWQLTAYTIGYNLDGGTVATPNPDTYTVESNDITLLNPTKSGFTFTGWTGTGLDAAATEVTIAHGSYGNREYTATWQADIVELADGTDYTRTEDDVVGNATYTKTIDDEHVGKHQAWLVPFDYTLTAAAWRNSPSTKST